MTADPALARASSPARFARIPYSFAKMHGVLAFAEEGDAIVVLTRPDATVEGIAELKRVLQRPLVDARRRSRALRRRARAHLQHGGVRRRRHLGRPRPRDRPHAADAGPPAGRGPARQRRAGAGDPDDQRAAAAGAARARVRPSLRALRKPLGRALSRRRHAARRDRAAARAARGAGLAAQDHGEPRHRREAPAAGRPHRAEARRQAGRRARLDAADRAGRARRAAPARQGFGRSSISRRSA